MSTTKKLIKSAQRLLRNVLQLGKHLSKQVMNWLLRNLFVLRRHPNSPQAGFVLPTVIMVMLVVTLLTTAILFRSFDRAKNASNVRINQATLSAATPALDRTKAKIAKLLTDRNLPRGTPSDESIASVIERNNAPNSDYQFDDEIPLEITDGTGTAHTAWRFPVDTDNNGKYDSFTVYSLLYQAPSSASDKRTPLQARTGPMTSGNVEPACAAAAGTSASLVGGGGWVNVGGILKKSMFVYVATVPITDLDQVKDTIPNFSTDPDKYEPYQKGNKGFSALELQADIPRVPLSNNAVVYEDDVEIFAGKNFTLNGRILTNSNLFVTQGGGLTFRQVSSPESCFYEEENSKIVVGGNTGYGYIALGAGTGSVNIHKFNGKDVDPTKDTLTTANQSATTTLTPAQIGYNNKAYEERIKKLVELGKARKSLPQEVIDDQKDFEARGIDAADAKEKALDRYFRKRTRRVPYAEVPFGVDENLNITLQIDDSNADTLRPPNDWIYPFAPDAGNIAISTTTATGYAKVSLNTGTDDTLLPKATEFETQEQLNKEQYVGDRVLIGNNLPELRYENGEWVGQEKEQPIKDTTWDDPADQTRARVTRVTTLADAGDITRNGFWEEASAKQPTDAYEPIGGLRVVTGAGLYLAYDDDMTIPNTSEVIWPDWMPVPRAADGTPIDVTAPGTPAGTPAVLAELEDKTGKNRPFLKMRAAAVYHYTQAVEELNSSDSPPPQVARNPIACVAMYYDPTDWRSARNHKKSGLNLPDVSGDLSLDLGVGPRTGNGARSVNGITYRPPNSDIDTDIVKYLRRQVYPNGRPVHPLLKDATEANGEQKTDASLAAKAAYDATNCAVQIYGRLSGNATFGDIGTPTETPGSYTLPYGAIQETAFMDARQIKAVDGDSPDITTIPAGGVTFTTDYTLNHDYGLAIEQRYPLEIRTTVLDLDKLRQSDAEDSPVGSPNYTEYMLPNSGIIYATRDDALPDASDDTTNLNKRDSNSKIAATDFELDPTRHPNGIMLVNGAKLYRERGFREEEKGLILASNLPVYIKAQPAETGKTLEGFNPHQSQSGVLQQEFKAPDDITPNADFATFYGRSEDNINQDFACRVGDTRVDDSEFCNDGDEWRNATVLSDAITLLSSSFREGYRNEGDYDLRNNQIDNVANANDSGADDIDSAEEIEHKRLWNGFWNNDFAINGLSSNRPTTDSSFPLATPDPLTTPLDDITPAPFPSGRQLTDKKYSENSSPAPLNSSYFNNMVTPVQRRVDDAPEYVMEYCDKLAVADCTPGDWKVGIPGNGNAKAIEAIDTLATDLVAGTTALPPQGDAIGKPRRIAFLRDTATNTLFFSASNKPIPLGIANNDTTTGSNPEADDTAQPFPEENWEYNTEKYCGLWKTKVACGDYLANLSTNGGGDRISPRLGTNTLWFVQTDGGKRFDHRAQDPLFYLGVADQNGTIYRLTDGSADLTGQPLLLPILQLQATTIDDDQPSSERNNAGQVHWQPRATVSTAPADTTIFNLVMASKDSPSRPKVGEGDHEGDIGGALSVFPRFLENWLVGSNPDQSVQIDGSFIQIGRSSYATAPFYQLPKGSATAAAGGLFGYPQFYRTGNNGKQPAYEAPGRAWGFDVGLLSQIPDLFAQNFAVSPDEEPNLFFREVSRNDRWLKPLLCAKTLDQNGNTGDFALPETERPSSCP